MQVDKVEDILRVSDCDYEVVVELDGEEFPVYAIEVCDFTKTVRLKGWDDNMQGGPEDDEEEDDEDPAVSCAEEGGLVDQEMDEEGAPIPASVEA
jgi:hypothetical protein